MIFTHPSFSPVPFDAQWKDESLFAAFDGGRILLSEKDDVFSLPTCAQIRRLTECSFAPFALARVEGRDILSVHPFESRSIPEGAGLKYHSMGIFRTLPFHDAALVAACNHLWNWYGQNRFCGSCGHALAPDSHERALRCSHCGRMVYPTICPAVIVAITCGDRILLAKSSQRPNAFYALVAGYVEVGETLEHAVHREVLEEVGIRLSSLRYIGNQPWGISGSHMFAFHATADDTQPITVQPSEIADARWFDRSELHPSGHAVSIAFELIERFRKGIL